MNFALVTKLHNEPRQHWRQIILVARPVRLLPRPPSADVHHCCRSFVRHKVGSSNISRTVWHWITKFYTDIHTNIPHSRTGYNVTNYFRLIVITKKLSKIPLQMTSGQISREPFERWSRNFTHLSGTISLTNLPDMTPLAAAGRLQNTNKYCIEVRKNGPSQPESNNTATV